MTNAKLAIGKLKSQGLGAWGTYTSGAYKPFLKNGVPATNVDTTTATASPGTETAAGDSFDTADCAWQMKLPVAGQTCILSKVQVRDIVSILLIGGSVVIAIFGVVALGVLGFKEAKSIVP